MHSGILRARQTAVFVAFFLLLTFLLLRLLYLQTVKHSFYARIANQQHIVEIELPPKRGTIFDRRMRVLAVNFNTDSVYANPRIMDDKRDAAIRLAAALNLSAGDVYARLRRDKAFVWIKRKVTPAESSRVKGLKIEGVDFVKESKRFYPNSSLACHIMGAVDIDNKGLEGLELLNDRYLKGKSGCLISAQDARRKLLQSYQNEFIPPKNGHSLVLTIDEVIQNIAERELFKMYDKYHAKGASIVVMNPKNGDILALANFPNFDLNDHGRRPADSVRNRAINDFFEPGSVFKVITASGLLEEKAVSLNDTFFCENGEYKIGSKTLHDVHPYGTLTFKQVIEKSSNIGTIKAASLLGPERMYKYVKAFGFGDTTGIDLPGEVAGIARPPSKWSKISMNAIPMGQEVTVTAMQLACAISVIADNGYLVRPRIVKAIIDEKGETVKEFPAIVRRKVITPETAALMRYILKGVVDNGTGRKAKIEEYTTGGKTGTGQKVEPSGGYSHDKFTASFIGFVPAEKPAMAIAVCVDEPRVVYYGGDVAAPVFRNVADQTLKYLRAKR
ncbi:MAG: penicillin-binding protein [Candidatus Omnitrophica bacterium]|nr:penicillin-binding protein [Candidatus Omnitrophota bacterium]